MKVYKEVLKKTEEITNILCNKCGKSTKHNDFGYNSTAIKVQGGYNDSGSVIYDGVELSFDICSHCMESYIKSFKIEPNKKETL